MLQNIKHKLAMLSGGALLNMDEAKELNAGKRIISLLAGAYMLQRGIKIVKSSPVLAIQELMLGGFLLYNGATGINLLALRKPREISEIRRNQIQGNDPDAVPAFV
jgi:uncharacterized membrane protein